MASPFTPDGLARFGFTIFDVKRWREKEHEAGRPSGLDDFYRGHGICLECRGHGKLVIGVRWRDSSGIEQSEEGSVGFLVQQHNLNEPMNWLNNSLKWDYLYTTCNICGGSGKLTR